MDKIQQRLRKLTGDVLSCSDPTSEQGVRLSEELKLFQELSRTQKMFEKAAVGDERVQQRLDLLTDVILTKRGADCMFSADTYIVELKTLQDLLKTWASADGVEWGSKDELAEERKSDKTWDDGPGTFTTKIKLTDKQEECLAYLDCGQFDKFLALGGSGSGKSFVLAYKVIRDTLRYKAPCLIARDAYEHLKQGMIDQVFPAILGLIAKANGQDSWKKWTIDGLKFAKLTDKKTVFEFATGGYVRFGGLSATNLSESGSDKILSPSWLHILLEEISELDYDIVEKLLTRLRHHQDGVMNTLMMCENPPSINHWSYKRYFENKREDGTILSDDEIQTMKYLLMNPQDNVDNLGETYIRNLSQMTGANYERFYLGQFQDTESGDIFKRIDWTNALPRPFEWDRIVVYTDPTPLTGKEHSVWADYKASVLAGLWQGETFVLDIRIVKGSTEMMLSNMKQLYDVSPNQSITDIVMENRQVPSDFTQVLTLFQQRTNWFEPIRKDNRIFNDKKGTIEMFLQPLFENNMIHFADSWRNTERGKQAQVQILKFSRKSNKLLKDDIPDAIMRADTWLKGKTGRKKKRSSNMPIVGFVQPGYIHGKTT